MLEECVCYNSGYVAELCSGELIIRCPVCASVGVHIPGSVSFVATISGEIIYTEISMKELIYKLTYREFRPNEHVTIWMVYIKNNFPPVLIGMCRKSNQNKLLIDWLRSIS